MRPEHPHPWCRIRYHRHRWLRPLRRRWPVWLLLGGVISLVLARFVEIRQLALTLVQGRWEWMLAALGLQATYYALYATVYRYGFATVGVQSKVRELVPVLFASMLAGTVAPTGGISAAAVLIEDAARREQSPARAAEGVLLVWVTGLAATVPLLAAGLLHLQLRGALWGYELIVSLIFLAYTGSLGGMLLLATWQPDRLRHLLERLQHRANALLTRLRRPLLPDDWAARNASESTGAAAAVVTHPGRVVRTGAVAVAAHLANMLCLGTLFLAFDRAIGPGALAAGFSLGYVFSIVSIVPFDLGVVEGIMTLVYTSLGVPAARALVISLAFRGLNTWLPVALSFLLFRTAWPPKDGNGE